MRMGSNMRMESNIRMKSNVRMESNDLQNGHPPPCGDLHSTNNDHIIARDTTIPHRPGGVTSGNRGGILRRYEAVSIAYDATSKMGDSASPREIYQLPPRPASRTVPT